MTDYKNKTRMFAYRPYFIWWLGISVISINLISLILKDSGLGAIFTIIYMIYFIGFTRMKPVEVTE